MPTTGPISWRQTGVDGDKLRSYEAAAGRFIAAFRVLGRQVGHQPPLIRPTLSLTKKSSFDDAIAAGERFATEFGLGDVPGRQLAEVMADRLGILVLMVDPIDGVSGAACQLPELDVVLINRNEVAGRRHFDLAHELFHIMTWDKMPPEHIEEVRPRKRNRVEQLADNFASALLMPSPVLDRFGDWAGLEGRALPDRLNHVADELLVTSMALRWRLHYEQFRAFHKSFYRAVEATSVTPFSTRALDRALAAMMVAAVRHFEPQLTPNNAASDIAQYDSAFAAVVEAVRRKMHLGGATPSQIDRCLSRLDVLRAVWIDIADAQTGGGDPFKYANEQPVRRLLQDSQSQQANMTAERRLFVAGRSMRETEPVALLRLRTPTGQKF